MKIILTIIVAFTSLLQAEIPAVAFKDITKNFKNKNYSPVMGRLALDSGFIYNLRHFGPFEPTYDKQPDGTERRIYDSDKPQDAMMTLLLKLFPSSAGPLASESTADSNFGKRATIQQVSDMLKFAKEVRDIVATSRHLQADPRSNWGLTDTFKTYEFLKELRPIINSCIRLEYNPTETTLPSKRTIKQEKFRRDNTREFQDIITGELEEAEKNRLYPLYTTEQLILAFFVHKFNNKADIAQLMHALGSEFVVDGWLPDEELWSLESLSSYPEKSDLDYVFFNTYHDISAPVPFADTINHGNCKFIKITETGEKEFDETKYGAYFADCQDTAIRHLFTIGFYEADSQTFNIPENIKNKYLRDFFEQQTPLKANDGSSEMRSLWNLVIGGLPKIRYRRGINEIDAGYINLVSAMRHVLGVKKDSLPQNKAEIISELKEIFQIMNPKLKDIKIAINYFTAQKDGFKGSDDEFYGDAVITITNAYDQTFSFNLYEFFSNAYIRDITWKTSSIPMGPADAKHGLLDKRNPKNGIYNLLAVQKFVDERQRIARVAAFSPEAKQQHIPIINRMMKLKIRNESNIIEAATIEAANAILPIISRGFILDSAFDIAARSNNDFLWNILFEKHQDKLLFNLAQNGCIVLNPNRLSKISGSIDKLRKVIIPISFLNTLDLAKAKALEAFYLEPRVYCNGLILPNSALLKEVKLFGKIKTANLSNVKSLERIILSSESIITRLILPHSKKELGNKLDRSKIIEIIYANPDGTVARTS